jgi:hypothetical protein
MRYGRTARVDLKTLVIVDGAQPIERVGTVVCEPHDCRHGSRVREHLAASQHPLARTPTAVMPAQLGTRREANFPNIVA